MTTAGSLLSIKRIYYRGKLNTCNYTCSYCPFGRKSHHLSTAEDRQAWERFITAIEQWEGEPLQLFIIPYGEALIHRYYREGIVHLAALPQVTGISCQTNLSFPAARWLDELHASSAPVGKMKLWASFHPEMTSVDNFVQQLHILHQAGMNVCAGAVGNPAAKTILSNLRNALSPEIYLFINAMQGLKTPLSEEDVRFLSQLDNLFEYDLKNASACWEDCSGGKSSCFVDWKGDMYACPRSHVKIGNFYEANKELDLSLPCKRKVCDCYIAFSNLGSHPLQQVMGDGMLWRIPEKPLISTVFFDIDGTLTDARGRIPESYAKALQEMSRSASLFLATSLSVEQAQRKLGKSLFGLFRGGVFADGGLLSVDGRAECLPVDALPDICKEKATRITAFPYEGHTYKYTMLVSDKEMREQILARLEEGEYQMFHKAPLVTVVHPQASKRRGVLWICESLHLSLDQVLVVGNSLRDWPMMSAVAHSCAVMNAESSLKERARYILNPDRLQAFFRFDASFSL